MAEPIQQILICGGGSSGWMTAAYLAKALNYQVKITLIDSYSIGRIGVGEATVPTIKTEFFDYLGIGEAEWMPKCQATYKLSVKFQNWVKTPEQGGDHYYHNFGEIPSIEEVPLTHIWIKKCLEENNVSALDYSCFSAVLACDLNKSPKYFDGTTVQHYAYHFDALQLADYLRDWATQRGVQHYNDTLLHAELDEQGNIKCVIGKSGRKYAADLFIDCTGFNALLIEKALKEPSVLFDDCLLTDRAIAFQTKENPQVDGIRPYTSASAMKHGWLWEIPLFNRCGNGYVYSSQFVSDEVAAVEARTYLGVKAKNVETKLIKFQSRRRERSWVKNCVSIGLASSFLEPLESTGIYFIYAALYQLVRNFPNKEINPLLRDKFNQKVNYMVEDVKNFIVMHFKTTPREDTEFWRANKYETKTPGPLQLILARQKAGIPIRKSHQGDRQLYSSFAARFSNFWTNSSYQCILCGVGYLPEACLPILNYRNDIMQRGNEILREIKIESKRIAATLPTQYDYLKYLYGINSDQQEDKIVEKVGEE